MNKTTVCRNPNGPLVNLLHATSINFPSFPCCWFNFLKTSKFSIKHFNSWWKETIISSKSWKMFRQMSEHHLLIKEPNNLEDLYERYHHPLPIIGCSKLCLKSRRSCSYRKDGSNTKWCNLVPLSSEVIQKALGFMDSLSNTAYSLIVLIVPPTDL